MFRSRWIFASLPVAAALSLAPVAGLQFEGPVLLAARPQSNDVARVFHVDDLAVEADWTPFINDPNEIPPGGLNAITKGPDGYLYVAYFNTDRIRRYYTDGTEDCSFVFPSGGGSGPLALDGPIDMVFGPDGALYVSSANNGKVLRFKLTQTGFDPIQSSQYANLASGFFPSYLAFLPNGSLLVACTNQHRILKFDNGIPSTFVSAGSGGLSYPRNLVWNSFGSAAQVLVASSGTNSVLRFHEITGAYVGQAAPTAAGEPLIQPFGLTIGPDQRLYVGCVGSDTIRGYNITWGSSTNSVTYGKSHYQIGDTILEPCDILWHSKPTAAFPIRKGQVVATYFEQLGGWSVKVVDPTGSIPRGRNSLAPMFSNELAPDPADRWNTQNIGSVFGITLDTKLPPNIYVASSTAYANPVQLPFPKGPGAVFKIDGWTGKISHWLSLPNTGPALGDICYDRWHDQFFVSNFEDGKIYRVKDTPGGGVIQQEFDPFAPDDGLPGYAPLGERVWAVHMLDPRLLVFSVWLSDRGRGAPSTWPAAWPPAPPGVACPNNALFFGMVDGSGQIFTVGTTGLFGPLVMPFFSGSCDTGTRYSNPVSDITDTSAGPGDTQFAHAALKGLLVTERTFVADYGFLNNGSSAHQARVMSFGAASNPLRWVQTPFVYHTGIHIHDSAGGIATDPKGEVWATADAIRARGVCDRLYGLHRIPKSGANPSPFPLDILIDLDHSTINWDKSSPGDVEYYGGPNLPSGCSPCN